MCPSHATFSFPGGSVVENLPASAADAGLIPWLGKLPGVGNGTPVFLPEKCHGQWNLVGYSPQGHRESDMTGSHAPFFPNFHSFLKTLPRANTPFLSFLKQLVIAFASQTVFDPWSI